MPDYLTLLKVTAFLILVALMAYLLLRFGLGRLQPGLGQGQIRIIQKVPLDLKGGMLLVLIRIGEQVLLLGSTQGKITVLKEFSSDILACSPGESSDPETFTVIFSKILGGYRDRLGFRKGGSKS